MSKERPGVSYHRLEVAARSRMGSELFEYFGTKPSVLFEELHAPTKDKRGRSESAGPKC